MSDEVRFKVVGGRLHGPVRGQDIAVIATVEDHNGVGIEYRVPALSATLRIGGRHELAVLTIEVPAVLVSVDGLRIETQAVVTSTPEKLFAETLGDGNLPIAEPAVYTDRPTIELDPALMQAAADRSVDFVPDTNIATTGRHFMSGEVAAAVSQLAGIHIIDASPPGIVIAPPDPFAELDQVIAAGGDVAAVLPKDA